MRYCGPHGVPHDEFLSWSRHSRDAALWWVIREAQTCRSCGTHPEEWDPAHGGDRHAYEARVKGCRGCQVRAGADADFERSRKEYPRGSYVALVRSTEERGQGGDRVDEG